jgi:hypothetical protein
MLHKLDSVVNVEEKEKPIGMENKIRVQIVVSNIRNIMQKRRTYKIETK